MSRSVKPNDILSKRQGYALSMMFILLSMTNPSFASSNSGSSSGTTIGKLAENITGSFSAITKLITGGAYVVGFALAMVGILKLKAHKDNPTQIPISTGLALIFVGAALVFLPALLGVGITTIFGDSSAAQNLSPSGTDTLILN